MTRSQSTCVRPDVSIVSVTCFLTEGKRQLSANMCGYSPFCATSLNSVLFTGWITFISPVASNEDLADTCPGVLPTSLTNGRAALDAGGPHEQQVRLNCVVAPLFDPLYSEKLQLHVSQHNIKRLN